MSLILANAPCNMKICLEESSRLEEEILHELTQGMSRPEDHDESSTYKSLKSAKELLRKRHECRTQVTPESLITAIEHRGKTYWSGPEAVCDYVALPFSPSPTSCCMNQSSRALPPVLLIRGEFDFITERCIAGWRKIFNQGSSSKVTSYREEVMENCAHYCHLEDEQSFGQLVNSHLFINDY